VPRASTAIFRRNVFIRGPAVWTAKGKTDAWEPLDARAPPIAAGAQSRPVGNWLDAIAQDSPSRESLVGGMARGRWKMVCARYQSALRTAQVPFPLTNRHAPAGLIGAPISKSALLIPLLMPGASAGILRASQKRSS